MSLFQRVATYDFKAVTTTIGGILIGGFSEDGGISYEMAADIGESAVGLGGEVVFSRYNDLRVFVDISVMETSRSYKALMDLLTLQQAQPIIAPLPFVSRDNISGETVTSDYAIFQTRPTPTKNRQAGVRTFRLLLPNAAGKIAAGI